MKEIEVIQFCDFWIVNFYNKIRDPHFAVEFELVAVKSDVIDLKVLCTDGISDKKNPKNSHVVIYSM